MTRKNQLRRMTESAMMIALATVLSFIKLVGLPMGGSVTACSMVPILVIAYRYGTGWGMFTGAVYGAFKMLRDMGTLRYATSLWALIAIILFDFVLAFGVLGLSGVFRGKLKNVPLELTAGAFIGVAGRYLCHFISGWAVWGIWAPEGMPAWQYSLGYQATYMVPECIITVLSLLILSKYLNFTGENITRRTGETLTTQQWIGGMVQLCGLATLLVALLIAVFSGINALLPDGEAPDIMTTVLRVVITLVLGTVLYAVGVWLQRKK